ncbi:MAG: glycosyltransferase, partial [Candidatus Omnitrophica bacterium]|nr:glycosyltransferase [Candidatus Omnitrophota bacterium]
IKKKMPGVRFIIAGKSMPRYLVRLAKDPSVRFVGFVPDIREFMKKVSLVIVPLRIGGGIRIKILDAWAAAKAVVSTSAGAEGLSIKNGEDIVIADTPRAFAGEVISLLKDGARRELIGRKAFTKVRELYGLEKVGAELERIYKDAVFEITKEPLTDIVVLNFNQERYTSECLFSLRNMAYKNFRVILVDNGSNDGSGRRLKNKFPEVELLESGQNLGFAGGCNRGIRRSLETGQADSRRYERRVLSAIYRSDSGPQDHLVAWHTPRSP